MDRGGKPSLFFSFFFHPPAMLQYQVEVELFVAMYAFVENESDVEVICVVLVQFVQEILVWFFEQMAEKHTLFSHQ